MEEAISLAAAESENPEELLRRIAAQRRELGRAEAVAIRRARIAGASWASIAVLLGVTRQAVHKRYGRR